jgi:hypothetical protein
MPKHLVALVLFALSTTAYAAAWEPLTSKTHPDCNASAPCRIGEPNGNFEVVFSVEPRGTMKKLVKIEIKDLKSEAKQVFALPEMNNIDENAFYEIYRAGVRAGKEADFAIHAFNSAHEGKVYYYFLYDPAQRKFSMSDGVIPKLTMDPKSKTFVSELQNTKYKLGGDLKFTLVK